MRWKIMAVITLIAPAAFAASPEEKTGCVDSPDVQSAEEVCSVYKKIEGYYGRYNMLTPGSQTVSKLMSAEPDACRGYYASYMRGRNILCAYQKESKVVGAKLKAAAASAATAGSNQAQNLHAAAANYKEAKDLHQKYLSLLTNNETELRKSFQTFAQAVNLTAFLGNEADGIRNRKQQLYYMLNTEMNCKGGSISNIPALWWGGAQTAHAKLLKETHPRILKAITSAKSVATEGVKHWQKTELATNKAASGLDNGGSAPAAPSVTHKDPGHQHEEGGELPLPMELGAGAALDKGTEILLELIELAPGPTKIVRFLMTLGFTGAVSHWNVGARDVLAAGVGLVSFPAGFLVTMLNGIQARGEAHRAMYTLWSQGALAKKDSLKPQELSHQFCEMIEEETRKNKEMSVQQALKDAQTPGKRFGDPGMPGAPGFTD